MGDYATVKFDAVLSELGVLAVSRLIHLQESRGYEYDDHPWYQTFADFAELKSSRFLGSNRVNHIPFGFLQFHPRGWPEENHYKIVEGNVWRVACSTKDTHSIYWFFHGVLHQLIAGPAVGYHWFELEPAPWEYVIEPGEGVTSRRQLEAP